MTDSRTCKLVYRENMPAKLCGSDHCGTMTSHDPWVTCPTCKERLQVHLDHFASVGNMISPDPTTEAKA